MTIKGEVNSVTFISFEDGTVLRTQVPLHTHTTLQRFCFTFLPGIFYLLLLIIWVSSLQVQFSSS